MLFLVLLDVLSDWLHVWWRIELINLPEVPICFLDVHPITTLGFTAVRFINQLLLFIKSGNGDRGRIFLTGAAFSGGAPKVIYPLEAH